LSGVFFRGFANYQSHISSTFERVYKSFNAINIIYNYIKKVTKAGMPTKNINILTY